MLIVQWAGSVALGLFAALAIVCNAALIVRAYASRKGDSLVPLLGGIAGTLAILISPLDAVRPYWWVPLVIDPGSAFLMIGTLIAWFIRRATCQPVEVSLASAPSGPRSVKLSQKTPSATEGRRY